MTSRDSADDQSKKSLYQRYQDAKRGKPIPDEEVKKHMGMSKEELKDWAQDRPGVGGNQAAGKLGVGPASGFAGLEAAHGVGGWGPDAKGDLKFPAKESKE
ncbi:hypothetical protein diail_5335 [Diaporthe ilicicola]|nr:hypothetical protein diail_5335 [Diaporthe ilicicola]